MVSRRRGRKLISIRTMIAGLVLTALALVLSFNVYWSYSTRDQLMSQQLLEQGRSLAAQMEAVWTFMDINQDVINYTFDGEYEFKGLYCAIVGKSVGSLFSKDTGYVTRYVSLSPRNPNSTPDPFEVEALKTFEADPSLAEVSGFGISSGGARVFRYMAPLKATRGCLECHGSPVGELDELGYPREGWEVGQLGGAISISIPVAAYFDQVNFSLKRDITYFLIVFTAIAILIILGLRTLVIRPLDETRGAMEQVSGGNLGARVSGKAASREFESLQKSFNDMAGDLQSAYENLEDKVAERTEQLEEANRRLTEESAYKSDFLAMMSHELKTPLAAISIFADVVRRSPDLNGEERRETADEISYNVDRLMRIINDILDMARLDAGKVEVEVELIDVADILSETEDFVRPLASEKGISFSIECSSSVPLIETDRNKLQHIMDNVVGNALKFTPEGGTINVSMRSEASFLTIMVEDTGVGIAPKDRERIFEIFGQGDSSETRKYGGSGLGLALASDYAKLLGGRVELVESQVGSGSTFAILLPSKWNGGHSADDTSR